MLKGKSITKSLDKSKSSRQLRKLSRFLRASGYLLPTNKIILLKEIILDIFSFVGLTKSIIGLPKYFASIFFLFKLLAVILSLIIKFLIDEDSVWKKKDQYIVIGKGKFNLWANMAEVGLSNAGTATELIAGLGIPSLSLPGSGPQFTKSFAKRQSRLLGGSVLVCKNKKILLKRLSSLLKRKVYGLEQAKIGKERMGETGASKKIVDSINHKLLS